LDFGYLVGTFSLHSESIVSFLPYTPVGILLFFSSPFFLYLIIQYVPNYPNVLQIPMLPYSNQVCLAYEHGWRKVTHTYTCYNS